MCGGHNRVRGAYTPITSAYASPSNLCVCMRGKCTLSPTCAVKMLTGVGWTGKPRSSTFVDSALSPAVPLRERRFGSGAEEDEPDAEAGRFAVDAGGSAAGRRRAVPPPRSRSTFGHPAVASMVLAATSGTPLEMTDGSAWVSTDMSPTIVSTTASTAGSTA